MNFQFESMSAFLHMEGHGLYVWLGYAAWLAVVIWLVARPIGGRRAVLRQLAIEIKRREARRETAQDGGEV